MRLKFKHLLSVPCFLLCTCSTSLRAVAPDWKAQAPQGAKFLQASGQKVALNSTKAEDSNKVNFDLSGFINVQMFYDTRQVAGGREDLLELYPLRPQYDPDGEDLNARPNLNVLGMISRLSVGVRSPISWPFILSARLEGDFSGQTNSDINGFRLRHAYIQARWKYVSLLAGQYWHPYNIIEIVPEVPGLHTGAPFRPFSRHPQIQVAGHYKGFRASLIASFQRDYQSAGPNGSNGGVVSNQFSRNAVMPGFDLQLLWQNKEWKIGADAGLKQLQPRTVTPNGYKSHEKMLSYSACIAASYTNTFVSVKAQGCWGQNMTEQIMLGGYIETGITNPTTLEIAYAPTAQQSLWLDISTRFKTWNAGIFAGYARNLPYTHPLLSSYTNPDGETISGKFYGRGRDIDKMFRAAARCSYRYKALVAVLEAEYTGAFYGDPDSFGRFANSSLTGNIRATLSLTCYF